MNGDDKTADALLNLPPSSICFGTRRSIQVRRSNDCPSTGMIATFSCKDNTTELPYLLVLLTDGKSTFSGRIHPSQATRVQWSDHHHAAGEQSNEIEELTDYQKVKILSCFLLNDEDRIQVTYDYTRTEQQQQQHQEGIKLVIQEMRSGLARTLGLHTLQAVPSNLSFCNIVGTFLNDSITEIHQLEKEKAGMKVDLLGWKDTATKLDQDWQTKKDGLFDNFLKLYKKAHGELGESRLEVTRLKRELKEARANMATSVTKKRPPASAPSYAALPDDNDAEQFDSEMVQMLAAGKPTRGGGKKKRSNSGDSTLKTSNAAADAAMRTNPHTGAKEVFDADALFQDSSFFESSQNVVPTAEAEKMDTKEINGKNDIGAAETNGKEEVDPVMAIASKLPAKAKTNDNGAPAAKRAKKDSTDANDKKDGSPSEEVDPIMAAASKLFSSKENTSNGGT